MKTGVIATIIFLSGVLFQHAFAQVEVDSGKTVEKKIEQLKEKKQEIAETEKALLKEDVKKINEKLKNEEITYEEAEILKQEAATIRALNIENQHDIIDTNIALLKRNQDEKYYFSVKYGEDKGWKEREDKDTVQTVSYPYIAFGLNNATIRDQSLENSPYKLWGSRFFEIGLEYNTTLTKSGFIRLKYGIAWQSNGLKLENNLYFVDGGEQTYLEEFAHELDKAKLSMNNIVIPVHFEFGPSTLIDGHNYFYSQRKKFKIGIGGYAGLNVYTVQKLKFEENGQEIKTKRKGNYNTSDFIYGLSAYIGYDWYALYIKYDLNPIFKDNALEQNTVSLGIRLAM